MLSDTLSDAEAEIRRYQEEMPHVYGHLRHDIDTVILLMACLRRHLDLPPHLAA